MKVARTSDERFRDLPDWPFVPNYAEISEGLRVHYVDEGSGPTVVLTHGEPTWSYLYRKMIPALVDAGCRVVAPDLVGFGRSDKPVERDEYSYGRHLRWLTETIDAIDSRKPLGQITLFCQDWGGLLGLVHFAVHSERYRGVIASNTCVPPGVDLSMPEDAPFLRWRKYSQETPEFSAAVCVGAPDSVLNQAGHVLSEGEARAYDAPFPSESHAAGPRQFPLLVPLSPYHPSAPICRRAWQQLKGVDVPLATLFSELDDVTAGMQGMLAEGIPGAKGQPHTTVKGAGHFIQEDAPAACVEATRAHLDRTA